MKLKNFKRNQTFLDEIKHFMKCIKTKKPTINDVNQGVRTLEIALAIKKSSKIKKMVGV